MPTTAIGGDGARLSAAHRDGQSACAVAQRALVARRQRGGSGDSGGGGGSGSGHLTHARAGSESDLPRGEPASHAKRCARRYGFTASSRACKVVLSTIDERRRQLPRGIRSSTTSRGWCLSAATSCFGAIEWRVQCGDKGGAASGEGAARRREILPLPYGVKSEMRRDERL